MVPLSAWPDAVERRASMCPECKIVRGDPISNLIGSGQQTLTYRCPTCATVWSHTKPSPKDLLDR